MTQAPASVDDVVELRPSVHGYRGAAKRRVWLMAPFVVVMFVRVLGDGDTLTHKLLIVVSLLVLIGITFSLAIVHIRTSVVRLSPGRVEHHALLVRNRSLSTDDIEGVLTWMRQPMAESNLLLVLRSPESSATVRLSGGLWSPAALETIAQHARVEISDSELSGREIEHRVPRSMPFHYRHPWAFGLLAALMIMVIVTAGTFGWFAYKDLPPFDDQPPRAVSTATVEAHGELTATIEAALPGAWELQQVTFHTCEPDDDQKGWTRWVSGRRVGGQPAGEGQFDALSDELVAHGFDDSDVSFDADGASLQTRTAGTYGEGTSVRVSQQPSGDVFVELHGPCEA